MAIEVTMCDGPLAKLGDFAAPGCGAVVCFEGVVRPDEGGRLLDALEYQAYEPMTSQQLHELGKAVCDECGVRFVAVEHSVGAVPVGAVSFRLRVGSEHRKEALRAIDLFVDRMKRDVALWKCPVFAERSAAV